MSGARRTGARPDLRLARERGFIVLPVRQSGAVQATGRVLRYDPAMPNEQRVPLVLAAIRPSGAQAGKAHRTEN